MSADPNFDRLIDKLLDETLSEEEGARLASLLGEDAAARERYFEYVNVHLGVIERSEIEAHSLVPTTEDSLGPEGSGEIESQDATTSAGHERRSNLGPWSFATHSVLAVALAASLALVWLLPQIWSPDGRAEIPLANTIDTTPVTYIAEIGAMSADVEWGPSTTTHEFLLRVRPGDRLELKRGLVNLTYFSGANIILRGPCTFTPTGPDSGELLAGELTGRVDDTTFSLTTPNAHVLDLGTEFGVAVDEIENTDVCVFEGKVKLTAGALTEESADTLMMTVGMAARATREGRIATDISIDADRFARSIPLPPSLTETGRLSLVDVMNGYEPQGYRLAIGIAPDTGEAYQQSWLAENRAYPRQRRGIYHATGWHPMVDGVFIPPRDGMKVQIDSLATTTTLPTNGAGTSGPIWSRRRVEDPQSIVFHENFWGGQTLNRVLQRLQACDWGMIGVHANAGITFDLDAIRNHYGEEPTRFQAIVANLDNSDQKQEIGETAEKRFVADFRLYVDGELRASRFKFGRTDGDMNINATIGGSDRFLTIVSTDAGHYWYDQVVLIDPVLELSGRR